MGLEGAAEGAVGVAGKEGVDGLAVEGVVSEVLAGGGIDVLVEVGEVLELFLVFEVLGGGTEPSLAIEFVGFGGEEVGEDLDERQVRARVGGREMAGGEGRGESDGGEGFFGGGFRDTRLTGPLRGRFRDLSRVRHNATRRTQGVVGIPVRMAGSY